MSDLYSDYVTVSTIEILVSLYNDKTTVSYVGGPHFECLMLLEQWGGDFEFGSWHIFPPLSMLFLAGRGLVVGGSSV
jgi:hypothetical protein